MRCNIHGRLRFEHAFACAAATAFASAPNEGRRQIPTVLKGFQRNVTNPGSYRELRFGS